MMGTLTPKDIYEELKTVADKLGITVSEQNFRTTGINVRSGLCTVRGKQMFLINKHYHVRKKVELLLELIQEYPHDDIYVKPAVRQLLNPGAATSQDAVVEPEPLSAPDLLPDDSP